MVKPKPEPTIWKILGVNTGVATGVLALFVLLGSIFRDWVTPILADQVFGLSKHVVEQVKNNNELIDKIAGEVHKRALSQIGKKIDAGYSISVKFRPTQGSDGSFSKVTESSIVAFHAKKGQRVCIAQKPVFNGVEGHVEIRIDGNSWKTISSHEDWDAPTDVTKLINFEGGLRAVHIHEVELVPTIAVDPKFALIREARGGDQFQPGTFMKLVILVYKDDARECLE